MTKRAWFHRLDMIKDYPRARFLLPILLLASASTLKAHETRGGDTLGIPFADVMGASDERLPAHWSRATWQSLASLDANPDPYPTRFKMLHSPKGIHILIEGEDRKVTGEHREDGGELYLGDVFEVFLHPEPATPVYFEYEVNAHDRELVLLVPNLGGRFTGWEPWRYEGDRKVVKRVRVQTGPEGMIGWAAELFIPFSLLSPLEKTPPKRGTVWHANVCRLDYDTGGMRKWSWSPVRRSFHEYKAFRPVRFE